MIDAHPDDFIALQVHVGDDWDTSWGYARMHEFYGAPGTPDVWFDGVTHVLGGVLDLQEMIRLYEDEYTARRDVPTDVTMQLTATLLQETTYRVSARICLESDGAAKDVRVYLCDVLDLWPTGGAHHRNGLRRAPYEQIINLTPGECVIVSHAFEFDMTSWIEQEDMKIIAWVQQPLASGPAVIHQGAQMAWPFAPDCNCNGIPDVNDIESGFSSDNNGDGVPDECAFTAGDMNCNGAIDNSDIDAFVLALTAPEAYATMHPECSRHLADCNRDGLINNGDIDPFTDLLVSR